MDKTKIVYLVEWRDIFSDRYEYKEFRTLAEARDYAQLISLRHHNVSIWKKETIKLERILNIC